jgi:glycosyltransferase involved in cell wall biosynthesis
MVEKALRICFLILNPFDYDSRARYICEDIIASGWQLDIIATVGGEMSSFEGAKIHRLPQPIKPFRQRRFIEYNWRAAALAKELKADIYHAVDLDTLWAACRAAKFNHAELVYESRELYIEQLALEGRLPVKLFWKALEKKLIKKADAVVTINESIAGELADRYGIKKPLVIPNVPRLPESLTPIDLRRLFNLNSKYIFVFQGILRPGQGIIRILKAVSRIDDVSLVFVGEGTYKSEIESWSTELGIIERIRFAGKIAPDRLLDYTAGGDAGVLLLEPVALNNYYALPQKLFQYIAAGVPPIVSDCPELRRVVENDHLGLVLEDGDVRDDVIAIEEFLKNRLESSAKACHIARAKYDWAEEGKKLIGLYKDLRG